MWLSIAICVVSFCWMLFAIRSDSVSMGLPIAYLLSLFLIHLPGAYANLMADWLTFSDLSEIGMRYTAIGSVSFVAGVWAARWFAARQQPILVEGKEWEFSIFCLIVGWAFSYGMAPLRSVPTLGAIVTGAGSIWMLGVALGLQAAVKQNNLILAAFWGAALAVYPVLVLLLGGFLSYGSSAVIIVLSALTVSIKHSWKVFVGIVVAVFVGLNLFVNYFNHRTEIRMEVWGGAPLESRIDVTLDIFRNFEWFSLSNSSHVIALDERLNQNFFVGLAADRIEQGEADYLYGRSIWEGMIAFVPRALWPGKPVVAGSPNIVAEMTGLELAEDTSFGVGNVMEFQINFGFSGVVGGFFLLGLLLRILDRRAGSALRQGDFGKVIMYYLPTLPMIQPNGSLVELCSGAAAALVGAYAWRWLWKQFAGRNARTDGVTIPAEEPRLPR